jgi:acyl carrier protein
MEIFDGIKEILADVLDLDGERITPETYLIRDLGAESIDLLELAVVLNRRFGIEIKDEEIFLGRLRLHVMEARQKGVELFRCLSEKYPSLSRERVEEIMGDLDGGPTLKVKDLVSYVAFRSAGNG